MRIIGSVMVYNEIDVIDQFLHHMEEHDIPLVVLDGGSTDGTYDIVRNSKAVLKHAQLITGNFDLVLSLKCVHAMTVQENPDWVVLVDADEFMEPLTPSLTLNEAISREAANGFNLINSDNFEFWPTPIDPPVDDIKARIRYYSWHDRWRFRVWKHGSGIRIHPSGGHLPIFPEQIPVRLSPHRFIIRHYSIRGYEHGRRKAFQERLNRYAEFDRKLFGLKRYENYRDRENYFVIEPGKLTRYDEGEWNYERKFAGWRKEPFLDLQSSEEVRRKMTEIAEQYSSFCID